MAGGLVCRAFATVAGERAGNGNEVLQPSWLRRARILSPMPRPSVLPMGSTGA